ncbi:helix-turn-helix domain-containing protein [Nocardia thailandica]|uniref:helix-turn-helix domain-containing protein n=1 Tax=Nocardia thailandica TaxID=257275 RepID=UPI0002E34E67|nr:helix-turn-helix transcriptional regulator [Nocardia thailandica]
MPDAGTGEAPPECALLKAAYKRSGLTVGDIADAASLSVGTIHIALSGVRYRDGKANVAVPPDRTLVKLAAVLGIRAEELRDVGRDRAAELLVEDSRPGPTAVPAERDAQAAASARAALAKQVLAAFSTSELVAEVERRARRALIMRSAGRPSPRCAGIAHLRTAFVVAVHSVD